MNIEIRKSELVEIEGLTEAAVASSDAILIAIVNYADLAASYLSADAAPDDRPGHPVVQLSDACMHELCRRHGDDYVLPEFVESPISGFSGRLMGEHRPARRTDGARPKAAQV